MVLIREKRIEQGLTQPELAKSINKDVPLISKFENFVCLPIPEDATKLAKTLKCTTILELYDEKDLTFTDKRSKAKVKTFDLNCYKLTAELPREAVKWLTRDNLKMMGYQSIKDWAIDCYYKLVKRIEKKKSRTDCNQHDSTK